MWQVYDEARIAKYFFPRNDKIKARNAMKLSRLQLSRFIRIITGHNQLKYYMSKLDSSISPLCRFCREADETFHHFVFDCPSLFFSRQEIFLDLDMNWTVDKLIKFSYLPHINSLLDPNSVQDIRLTDSESDSQLSANSNSIDNPS